MIHFQIWGSKYTVIIIMIIIMTIIMSSFIGQDQIEKIKLKKNKKLKIYKHKELKPKMDGHKRDTKTHAGCLP